jgi:hypothetical protein
MHRKMLLLLRGLLGFGAVSLFYWAVQYLPLADVAVLMFLAPVFVAGVCAKIPCLWQQQPAMRGGGTPFRDLPATCKSAAGQRWALQGRRAGYAVA